MVRPSSHYTRQIPNQQVDQPTGVRHAIQTTHHRLAPPTKSGQSPFLLKAGEPNGAESVIIPTNDLILVCPLFFEQRQSAFGVLFSAQKINTRILSMHVFSSTFKTLTFCEVMHLWLTLRMEFFSG
jgi:hypothetical protein